MAYAIRELVILRLKRQYFCTNQYAEFTFKIIYLSLNDSYIEKRTG